MVIDTDGAGRRCPLYNFSGYIQSFEIAPDFIFRLDIRGGQGMEVTSL